MKRLNDLNITFYTFMSTLITFITTATAICLELHPMWVVITFIVTMGLCILVVMWRIDYIGSKERERILKKGGLI